MQHDRAAGIATYLFLPWILAAQVDFCGQQLRIRLWYYSDIGIRRSVTRRQSAVLGSLLEIWLEATSLKNSRGEHWIAR